MSLHERRFSSGGISHSYSDTHPEGGIGSTLILIHGFPHTQKLWAGEQRALQDCARVITYDLRGFGKSELGDGHLLLDFFVDDLIDLMDHLRLERVSVGGLSMGGYIALRALDLHPERFERLILSNTGADADTNAGKLKRAGFIRMIRERGYEDFVEDFIQGVFQPETLARDPEVLHRFRSMILENGPRAVGAGLIALAARMDMNESLQKIQIPTLIIAGERDQVTPVALSERMHATIPASELRVIPGAGHISNWENPGAYQETIRRFLRTQQ